ncbi:MAG TPA: hypothetical protein VFM83_09920 [Gaiellaceae bacterium]|nr:hypothetical protein [Gaiellaceae bacterium]
MDATYRAAQELDMSEVDQEQRSGWRSWFRSTGAPPAWGLVRYMVCGLVAGAALSAPLPESRGTLLAALAGVVVAAAGSGGPSGISRRVALIAAVLGLLLTVVALATGNRPVLAALAMAAVALLTSLAPGAVGNWAERRLIDTAMGCAVALIATYLLWPRDREVKEPVPAPT